MLRGLICHYSMHSVLKGLICPLQSVSIKSSFSMFVWYICTRINSLCGCCMVYLYGIFVLGSTVYVVADVCVQ